MTADHDNFVLQLWIGSGDFGDGVETLLVISGKFSIRVEFQIHRHIGLQQPIPAA